MPRADKEEKEADSTIVQSAIRTLCLFNGSVAEQRDVGTGVGRSLTLRQTSGSNSKKLN
jgi:hypothetical protein